MNGTYDEVAEFFRVTVQTVALWKKTGDIGCFQKGRAVTFGEQHVVDFWVANSREARGLKPGEAAAIALEKWRQFLKSRQEASELRPAAGTLNDFMARLERLEKRMGLAPELVDRPKAA